ncbi:hypothetical protein TNCV_3276591 [Trichonephila clavipes]|nr:hypothetical protein TNCV_3276591 [Trichonephila clavipes]
MFSMIIRTYAEKLAVSDDFYLQRYKGAKQMPHTVKPWLCPKQIPKVNLVRRAKHNTAFVRFTLVNNQEERNNIQENAQICQSRKMEQNIHR